MRPNPGFFLSKPFDKRIEYQRTWNHSLLQTHPMDTWMTGNIRRLPTHFVDKKNPLQPQFYFSDKLINEGVRL